MEISQQRGAIPLTLDRPRLLLFDLAATWLLVEQYGMEFVSELYIVRSTPRLVDVTSRNLADVPAADRLPQTTLALKSMDALRFFLWAGLRADDPALTLDQAGDFVVPSTIRPIFYALVRALTASLTAPAPLPSGKAEAARPAAKRPAKSTPKKAVKAST